MKSVANLMRVRGRRATITRIASGDGTGTGWGRQSYLIVAGAKPERRDARFSESRPLTLWCKGIETKGDPVTGCSLCYLKLAEQSGICAENLERPVVVRAAWSIQKVYPIVFVSSVICQSLFLRALICLRAHLSGIPLVEFVYIFWSVKR
jgi:hypothetical protein